MALRCLAVAPDVFCAAVAGAPVTSWELYESLYTENYLGRPQVDPATHSASSVLSQVERLRGRVLIVHGLIDGNVHFRHSARLIDPLLAAGVDHEVLLLPEERHHVREEANRQMVERCILAFLCRCTRAAARLIATAAGMTGPTAGCGEARRRR
jgi:dipeptidyl-peptidase-4